MRGLVVSLLVFVLYVIAVAVLLRNRNYSRPALAFRRLIPPITITYFALFILSPPDLWFCKSDMTTEHTIIDSIWGYAVLLLNIHNFMDVYFALNGGLSTSLLYEILLSPRQALTRSELCAFFQSEQQGNHLIALRLQQLTQQGYLKENPDEGIALTLKGRWVAGIARQAKRLFGIESHGE